MVVVWTNRVVFLMKENCCCLLPIQPAVSPKGNPLALIGDDNSVGSTHLWEAAPFQASIYLELPVGVLVLGNKSSK